MMYNYGTLVDFTITSNGTFLDAANKSRHVGVRGIDGFHILKSGYEKGDTPKMIQIWKEINIIGCLKVLRS